MKLLSEDDLNLQGMTDEELAAAWDLWFDLAQATNDFDPPYTHGVFVNLTAEEVASLPAEEVALRQRALRGGAPVGDSRAGATAQKPRKPDRPTPLPSGRGRRPGRG